MAFKKEMLAKILPIPEKMHMHDHWIGMMNDKYGKSVFLPEKLILYRRHDSNNSSMEHMPLGKMILKRLNVVYEYLTH